MYKYSNRCPQLLSVPEDKQENAFILTGATGLVDFTTLLALMGMKDIAKISILSHRPVPMIDAMKDECVDVIIHDNFEKYDSTLLDRLRGANRCVWAFGISQNAVGKEEYIRITNSMTLEAAWAFGKIKSVAAANSGHEAFVQLLLEAGADPNSEVMPFPVCSNKLEIA